MQAFEAGEAALGGGKIYTRDEGDDARGKTSAVVRNERLACAKRVGGLREEMMREEIYEPKNRRRSYADIVKNALLESVLGVRRA